MLQFKLSKAVKRIVIPQQAATGGAATGAPSGAYVLKHKKKRKKLAKGTRLFEKLIRRSARAQSKGANEYLYRHNRSNRKHKNGWLRDLANNIWKGNRKGRKSVKLSKLF